MPAVYISVLDSTFAGLAWIGLFLGESSDFAQHAPCRACWRFIKIDSEIRVRILPKLNGQLAFQKERTHRCYMRMVEGARLRAARQYFPLPLTAVRFDTSCSSRAFCLSSSAFVEQ